MPRVKLTKSAIDDLPTPAKEVVYWDAACPGFGVKVTPTGRKVFVVLYRTGGAGSRLRKYTIGPYGRVTLHQARVSAQKVFAARLEGRDLAAEKRAARKRITVDRVEDLLEAYISQHVSQNRSARGTSQMLRRELASWSGRSIHEISKRDVIEVVSRSSNGVRRVAANKIFKAIKTFLRWCVGRAVLEHSPAEGIPLPTKEVARDRVLTDDELARVIIAAREIGGPYGGIVELLALTGQRREEVARCVWDEIDLQSRMWTLPNLRTKNAKPHIVHLSDQALAVLGQAKKQGTFVFSATGDASVPRLQHGEARTRCEIGRHRMASSRSAAHLRVWDGSPRRRPSCGRQNSQPPIWDDLWGRCRVSAAPISFGAQRSVGKLGRPRRSDRVRGVGCRSLGLEPSGLTGQGGALVVPIILAAKADRG